MLCAEETSGGDLDSSIDPAVSSLCRWISPQTCLLCDKKRATSSSGISSGQNSDEKDKGTTILLNTPCWICPECRGETCEEEGIGPSGERDEGGLGGGIMGLGSVLRHTGHPRDLLDLSMSLCSVQSSEHNEDEDDEPLSLPPHNYHSIDAGLYGLEDDDTGSVCENDNDADLYPIGGVENEKACNCNSCERLRQLENVSKMRAEELDRSWVELRDSVRSIYRSQSIYSQSQLEGISKPPPPHQHQFRLREMATKLSSSDAHLLFRRLEAQAIEYVVEVKARLLHRLTTHPFPSHNTSGGGSSNNSGGSGSGRSWTPSWCVDFVESMLNEFTSVGQSASSISEIIAHLEQEHLSLFKMTWAMHNRNLFRTLCWEEPLLRRSLKPMLQGLTEGCSGCAVYPREKYISIYKQYVEFSEEMTVMGVVWGETEALLDMFEHSLSASQVRTTNLSQEMDTFQRDKFLWHQQISRFSNSKAFMSLYTSILAEEADHHQRALSLLTQPPPPPPQFTLSNSRAPAQRQNNADDALRRSSALSGNERRNFGNFDRPLRMAPSNLETSESQSHVEVEEDEEDLEVGNVLMANQSLRPRITACLEAIRPPSVSSSTDSDSDLDGSHNEDPKINSPRTRILDRPRPHLSMDPFIDFPEELENYGDFDITNKAEKKQKSQTEVSGNPTGAGGDAGVDLDREKRRSEREREVERRLCTQLTPRASTKSSKSPQSYKSNTNGKDIRREDTDVEIAIREERKKMEYVARCNMTMEERVATIKEIMSDLQEATVAIHNVQQEEEEVETEGQMMMEEEENKENRCRRELSEAGTEEKERCEGEEDIHKESVDDTCECPVCRARGLPAEDLFSSSSSSSSSSFCGDNPHARSVMGINAVTMDLMSGDVDDMNDYGSGDDTLLMSNNPFLLEPETEVDVFGSRRLVFPPFVPPPPPSSIRFRPPLPTCLPPMHDFEDSNEGVDDDFEDLTPYVYAAKNEASSGEIADDDDRKEKVTTDDKAKDQEKKKTASLGLDPSWRKKLDSSIADINNILQSLCAEAEDTTEENRGSNPSESITSAKTESKGVKQHERSEGEDNGKKKDDDEEENEDEEEGLDDSLQRDQEALRKSLKEYLEQMQAKKLEIESKCYEKIEKREAAKRAEAKANAQSSAKGVQDLTSTGRGSKGSLHDHRDESVNGNSGSFRMPIGDVDCTSEASGADSDSLNSSFNTITTTPVSTTTTKVNKTDASRGKGHQNGSDVKEEKLKEQPVASREASKQGGTKKESVGTVRKGPVNSDEVVSMAQKIVHKFNSSQSASSKDERVKKTTNKNDSAESEGVRSQVVSEKEAKGPNEKQLNVSVKVTNRSSSAQGQNQSQSGNVGVSSTTSTVSVCVKGAKTTTSTSVSSSSTSSSSFNMLKKGFLNNLPSKKQTSSRSNAQQECNSASTNAAASEKTKKQSGSQGQKDDVGKKHSSKECKEKTVGSESKKSTEHRPESSSYVSLSEDDKTTTSVSSSAKAISLTYIKTGNNNTSSGSFTQKSTPAGQKVPSNDTQSSTSTVAEVKVSCTSDSAVGSATTPHSHNTTQTHSHSSVSEGHKGHASGANGGGVLSNGCKNTDKCHCFLAGNTTCSGGGPATRSREDDLREKLRKKLDGRRGTPDRKGLQQQQIKNSNNNSPDHIAHKSCANNGHHASGSCTNNGLDATEEKKAQRAGEGCEASKKYEKIDQDEDENKKRSGKGKDKLENENGENDAASSVLNVQDMSVDSLAAYIEGVEASRGGNSSTSSAGASKKSKNSKRKKHKLLNESSTNALGTSGSSESGKGSVGAQTQDMKSGNKSGKRQKQNSIGASLDADEIFRPKDDLEGLDEGEKELELFKRRLCMDSSNDNNTPVAKPRAKIRLDLSHMSQALGSNLYQH